MSAKALPNKSEATLGIALEHHRAGRLDEAEKLYRQVIAKTPKSGDAHHLLGLVHLHRGDAAGAIQSINTALSIKSEAAYYSSLGNALAAAGRKEEACAALRSAIRMNPNQPDAHSNLGLQLQELGQAEEAIASYRRALALRPAMPEAHYNMGVALKVLGRLDEAVEAYRNAIKVHPNFPEAYTNMGVVLQEQGKFEEAVAAHRAALQLRPTLAEAHSNLGISLQELGRMDEAEAAYRAALAVRPGYPEALSNLGFSLMEQGRLEEAVAACRQAIAARPDYIEAHCTLAGSLLMMGDLVPGWEEYEWRWLKGDVVNRVFAEPQWNGEDLHGKTLLIHHEQGLGDTIQFIRYLPAVVARGGNVLLELPAHLRALLAHLEGVTVINRGDPLPPFDLHCPMLSLPRAFGTSLATIPAEVPYLQADPARVEAWRQRLPADGFRIGIVWQGKPGVKIDRGRSFPLACFAPVARLPGVKLVSLQKNFGLEQLEALPEGMQVHTLGDDFDEGADAFLDTVAVMMSLDLVITSDTSIAHLAGALGRPVWVVLKYSPDWRWLRGREDCPWYPSMRLFRQTEAGKWEAAFDHVAEQLARVLAGDRAALAPDPATIPPPPTFTTATAAVSVPVVASPAPEPVPASPYAEVHSRHGVMRYFRSDAFIGRSLALYGEWSEAENVLCTAVLRPGDVVVEAGSNIGAHTLGLARTVGPNGCVHAFEPQRPIYELLHHNVTANGLTQVVVHHAAAGAQPGSIRVPTIDYTQPGNFGGVAVGGQGGESVPVLTIDGLDLPSLRLLKADVEGAEMDVLRGAMQTIARCRPVLYLENDRKDTAPALIALIQSLGYRLWWHLPTVYSPANYFGNAQNVFDRVISVNMLCVPAERDCVVVGLREITSPSDDWRIP